MDSEIGEVRQTANDAEPIYTATYGKIKKLKEKYRWWYEVTTSSTEVLLVFAIKGTVRKFVAQ